MPPGMHLIEVFYPDPKSDYCRISKRKSLCPPSDTDGLIRGGKEEV
jgi:hypothetical protein